MIKCIFIILCMFALTSCSKEVTDDFFAMDTYMNVTLFGTDNDVREVKQEVYRLNKLLKWDTIDEGNEEIILLVDEANQISEFTNGAFDIGVAPFLEIWGFRDKNYRVPSQSEIIAALNLNEKRYDFGGIGKGYAGRKLRELLIERGVTSAIISLGGNVQTVGTKPNGEPWSVGIQNPDGEGYSCFVKVSDMAVVTSGGYHRFFEKNGQKYSHIINPKTGCPAQSDIKSVTVVCFDGATADGLSTAFYVMGCDATVEFCKKVNYTYKENKFAVVIIDNQNNIYELGNIKVFEG